MGDRDRAKLCPGTPLGGVPCLGGQGEANFTVALGFQHTLNSWADTRHKACLQGNVDPDLLKLHLLPESLLSQTGGDRARPPGTCGSRQMSPPLLARALGSLLREKDKRV